MKKTKKFIFDGMLLTATALIMRTVGVVFNAYISDKLTKSGMGLFTLVMSVYSFAVTFATSGINLAATRLTAEAMGHGNSREIRDAMVRCIIYSLFFGCVGGMGLYFGAEFFGGVLMGDERTVPSLRLLSFGLPYLSVSSALNGYFTAVRRVIKSAACQFFEQLLKILFTVLGFAAFLDRGLEYGCLALVGASMLAETLSALLAFILYIADLKKHNDRSGGRVSGLTGKLCGIALPVAVSAYFRSGLLTAEHMLIPWGLKRSGVGADAALASYGVVQGMVLPVVLYPSAFIAAFTSLLIPEFAEDIASGERERNNRIADRAIGATLVFSIGVAAVMMSFSEPLGLAIYKSRECGYFIRLIGALIPVMYLDGVVDAMLKGMGYQFYSMVVNIIDALVSCACVFVLVPRMGINGYVVTIFIGEILNFALSISKLLAHSDIRVQVFKRVVFPLAAGIGATSIAHLIFRCTSVNFWLQIIVACAIYICLLFTTGSLDFFGVIRRRRQRDKSL